MTTLKEWREERSSIDPQGNTVAEALEKRKALKGISLETARTDISKGRIQTHQALIEEVVNSAKITLQEDMIAEIGDGKSINEVLAKYGVNKQT